MGTPGLEKKYDVDFRCRLGWEDCISGASYYICIKCIYIRQYHVILQLYQSWQSLGSIS